MFLDSDSLFVVVLVLQVVVVDHGDYGDGQVDLEPVYDGHAHGPQDSEDEPPADMDKVWNTCGKHKDCVCPGGQKSVPLVQIWSNLPALL